MPKRIKMAKALQNTLIKEGLDPALCVDLKMVGSWFGHKKAMKAYKPGCTHHLVLEEDAIPCKQFKEKITEAILSTPNSIISLYAGRGQKSGVRWARKNNYTWFKVKYGCSGLAVIFPLKTLINFLMWENQICPPDMPYEDSRLWGYLYERDEYVLNTVPSLVEHGAPMESSMGFNNKGKVAEIFYDDDPVELDWKAGLDVDRTFKYKWGEQTYMKWVKGKNVRN